MTGVTHGADASRLHGIATELRDQGTRVQDIGDLLGPRAEVLREAWSGADSEMLLHDVSALRPVVASIGATLVSWAGRLHDQADEQVAGSGGALSGGGDVRDGLRAIGGLVGRLHAPSARSGPARPDLTNAIGEGPQSDPGDKRQPGFVSNSDTKGVDKGLKVEVTATETVGVSTESVDSEGRSVQTTTVSARVEAGIGGEAGGGGTGGSFGAGGGTEVSYSVTAPVGVDPESIDPTDPASWPPGTSVRFDEEYFMALEAEASFRGLIAGTGLEFGTGTFVEVSAGDGSEVTVLVGDSEFDRSTSQLGIGTSDANVKAGASSDFTTGTAKEVTIDLSSPEGQRAYADLLGDGTVPTAGAPGVVDVADLTVLNASRSIDVSGTLGDLSAGGDLAHWEAGGVQRTHADGTTTLEWTGEQAGTQVGGVATFDADGTMVVEDNTYYLRMEGVDPATAGNYNRNYLGEDVSPTGEHNVVLDLTHDDLTTMRNQAAATQASLVNANPEDYPDFPAAADGHVSSEDVLRHVEGNPDGIHDLAGVGGTGQASLSILAAQSDQEVLRTLMATQGPLEFQQELATDHHSATGQRLRPVGEVTSQPSA